MIYAVIILALLLVTSLSLNVLLGLEFISGRRVQQETEEGDQPLRVAIIPDQSVAFWVGEEGLMTAPLDQDNEVMYDDQEKVNTDDLSIEQMQMLSKILNILKEDEDEDSGTWEQEL